MASAFLSIRFCGIEVPRSVRGPVMLDAGSYNSTPRAEKSPFRSAKVGTEEKVSQSCRARFSCVLRKKKVRWRPLYTCGMTSGPPSLRLNMSPKLGTGFEDLPTKE